MTSSTSSYIICPSVSDIDGYDILFYSQYMKYNARALFEYLNELLPGISFSYSLKEIKNIRFSKQVLWSDSATITTTILEFIDRNVTVYQEWRVGTELKNQSVSVYTIMSKDDISRLYRNCVKDNRQMNAFLKSSTAATLPTDVAPRADCYKIFNDMIDSSHILSVAACLDLVEKSRTNIFGGCLGLQALKANGKHVVVASIDSAYFFDTPVYLGDTVKVISRHALTSNDFCVWVRQSIENLENKVLFEYQVKLFLFDAGVTKSITKLSDDLSVVIKSGPGFVSL